MATSYASGLNFSWPTKGDTNYSGTINSALAAISGHRHEGAGTGNQIRTAGLVADAVTGAKIRLDNNESLRGRNQANNANVNLLRLTTNNFAQILPMLVYGDSSTNEALSANGAISLTAPVTSLSGSATAMSLANATATGQLKLVVTSVVSSIQTSGSSIYLNAGGAVLLYGNAGADWTIVGTKDASVIEAMTDIAHAWTGHSDIIDCSGSTYTITAPTPDIGKTVIVTNRGTGNVTFGGQVMATNTYYLYFFRAPGVWVRTQLT